METEIRGHDQQLWRLIKKKKKHEEAVNDWEKFREEMKWIFSKM